jgi:hypothetical protein
MRTLHFTPNVRYFLVFVTGRVEIRETKSRCRFYGHVAAARREDKL